MHLSSIKTEPEDPLDLDNEGSCIRILRMPIDPAKQASLHKEPKILLKQPAFSPYPVQTSPQHPAGPQVVTAPSKSICVKVYPQTQPSLNTSLESSTAPKLREIEVKLAKAKEDVKELERWVKRTEKEWDDARRLLRHKEEKLMHLEAAQALGREDHLNGTKLKENPSKKKIVIPAGSITVPNGHKVYAIPVSQVPISSHTSTSDSVMIQASSGPKIVSVQSTSPMQISNSEEARLDYSRSVLANVTNSEI